jgi:tetratricopeptide (TPR) repeat protein
MLLLLAAHYDLVGCASASENPTFSRPALKAAAKAVHAALMNGDGEGLGAPDVSNAETESEALDHRRKGNALYRQGDLNGALREWELSVALHPSQSLGIRNNIVQVLIDIGEPEAAFRASSALLERVDSANSSRPAIEQRAKAHYRRGMALRAIFTSIDDVDDGQHSEEDRQAFPLSARGLLSAALLDFESAADDFADHAEAEAALGVPVEMRLETQLVEVRAALDRVWPLTSRSQRSERPAETDVREALKRLARLRLNRAPGPTPGTPGLVQPGAAAAADAIRLAMTPGSSSVRSTHGGHAASVDEASPSNGDPLFVEAPAAKEAATGVYFRVEDRNEFPQWRRQDKRPGDPCHLALFIGDAGGLGENAWLLGCPPESVMLLAVAGSRGSPDFPKMPWSKELSWLYVAGTELLPEAEMRARGWIASLELGFRVRWDALKRKRRSKRLAARAELARAAIRARVEPAEVEIEELSLETETASPELSRGAASAQESL